MGYQILIYFFSKLYFALVGRKIFLFQLGFSGWGPANELTVDSLTGEKMNVTYICTREPLGNE